MAFPNALVSMSNPSVAQVVVAGSTLSSSPSGLIRISAAGVVATDTVTVIEAGLTDGQRVTYINTSANAITIKGGGNAYTTAGGDVTVTQHDVVSFVWLASTSKWYQTGAVAVNA